MAKNRSNPKWWQRVQLKNNDGILNSPVRPYRRPYITTKPLRLSGRAAKLGHSY